MVTIANIIIISQHNSEFIAQQLHQHEKFFNITLSNSIQGVEKHQEEIHLIILDCEGFLMDGIEYIQYLRGKGIETPLIFLSHNYNEEKIEQGFIYGADDHIAKPYSIKELLYRSKALLRRTHGLKYERISYKDILLDCNTRKVYIDGIEVELTKQKFDLLKFFIEHKKIILERDYILKAIWKDEETQKRTVNVTINRLIKKIDPDGSKNYFTAIRSIGYRLN